MHLADLTRPIQVQMRAQVRERFPCVGEKYVVPLILPKHHRREERRGLSVFGYRVQEVQQCRPEECHADARDHFGDQVASEKRVKQLTDMLEKLDRSWFQTALDFGCKPWDVIIHKALSTYLQASLNCGGDDISQSRRYEVEFMRWEHLKMKFTKGGKSVDDMEPICILAITENEK